MSAVSNVAAGAAQAPGRPSAPQLGQADFLRLMTAQMTMQDPFAPMDGREMLQQMAQFSQVAGIAEMNKSLAALAAGGSAQPFGIDPGWIGRNALVAGDRAAALFDGSYAGEIALAAPAAAVTLRLRDAAGAVVREEAFGPRPAGALVWAWDGEGVPGPLSVEVDAGGAPAANASWTPIRAIQSPAGGAAARLHTPLGLLKPEQATRLA